MVFKKNTVCVIVRNELDDDPRVSKTVDTIANSFKSNDQFQLDVVCFVDNKKPRVEKRELYTIYRYDYGLTKAKEIRSKVVESSKAMDKEQSIQEINGSEVAFFYLLYLNLKFTKLIIKRKASVYYANDLDVLPTAWFLSRIHRSKLIYDSHELYNEQSPLYTRNLKKLYAFMERFIIKQCNEVITVNESISNELSSRYGIPKPHVIMNYPRFEKSSNISHNSPQHVKILYHGGFAKERGIEEIIESMKYADERFLLYLRGFDESDNSPYKKFLNNIIVSNNLSNKVFFIPKVPMKDLIKSIDSFDIGIIPYKPTCLNNRYASPNKTFEYMMGGLALAVSDIPEQRKIIDTYNNGVYFNPDSPNDISQSLNSILDDPARISHMKNESLYAAKNFLNWETQEYKIVLIMNRYII